MKGKIFKEEEVSLVVLGPAEATGQSVKVNDDAVPGETVSVKAEYGEIVSNTVTDVVTIEKKTGFLGPKANVVISFSLEDVASLIGNSFSLDLNFAEAEVA